MSVAKKLRAWLEANELGPTEFARQIKVSHATVSDWLAEKKTPKRHNAIAIERRTSKAVTRVDCGYAPAE